MNSGDDDFTGATGLGGGGGGSSSGLGLGLGLGGGPTPGPSGLGGGVVPPAFNVAGDGADSEKKKQALQTIMAFNAEQVNH